MEEFKCSIKNLLTDLFWWTFLFAMLGALVIFTTFVYRMLEVVY